MFHSYSFLSLMCPHVSSAFTFNACLDTARGYCAFVCFISEQHCVLELQFAHGGFLPFSSWRSRKDSQDFPQLDWCWVVCLALLGLPGSNIWTGISSAGEFVVFDENQAFPEYCFLIQKFRDADHVLVFHAVHASRLYKVSGSLPLFDFVPLSMWTLPALHRIAFPYSCHLLPVVCARFDTAPVAKEPFPGWNMLIEGFICFSFDRGLVPLTATKTATKTN